MIEFFYRALDVGLLTSTAGDVGFLPAKLRSFLLAPAKITAPLSRILRRHFWLVKFVQSSIYQPLRVCRYQNLELSFESVIVRVNGALFRLLANCTTIIFYVYAPSLFVTSVARMTGTTETVVQSRRDVNLSGGYKYESTAI